MNAPVRAGFQLGCEGWLTAPADVALVLQRPLPDDKLVIVALGEREDTPVLSS